MRIALGLILMVVASATDAVAGELRLTTGEIAALAKGGAGAGSSGVSGIQTTVLSGDPTKPGPYTIEIRVPANTRIAAHHHRDGRTAVVVSGTWRFGYGGKADEALTKALGPSGFYTEPADQPHFAMTGAEPAVVYITGAGPTDTVYERAADDPRRQAPAVSQEGEGVYLTPRVFHISSISNIAG